MGGNLFYSIINYFSSVNNINTDLYNYSKEPKVTVHCTELKKQFTQ
jgi:hypothetical protein